MVRAAATALSQVLLRLRLLGFGQYDQDTEAVTLVDGVVEAVGPDVTDLAVGDHVIGCITSWCGVCKFCTGGRPYLCPTQYEGRPLGSKPRLVDANGDAILQFANLSSFAEKMLCPERSLVKIRDDMPLDRASLIGCGVTTGLGAALNTVNIPAGASVVIIGCGGVGLSALQGARIRGAGKIIAVDAQPWKFDLARKLGANVPEGDFRSQLEANWPGSDFRKALAAGVVLRAVALALDVQLLLLIEASDDFLETGFHVAGNIPGRTQTIPLAIFSIANSEELSAAYDRKRETEVVAGLLERAGSSPLST